MTAPDDTTREGQDRCDKCGLHISKWNEEPVCKGATVTQSPRHKITRFYLGDPRQPRKTT